MKKNKSVNPIKILLCAAALAVFSACGNDSSVSLWTDARDGQTYKIVVIGPQTWMAQNLNYETANSYCYDDDVSHCARLGRLYTWSAAMEACPEGWHLPSKGEFETLFTTVGGSSNAAKVLKSRSGWFENANGTDDFSFSALPAGNRLQDGKYYNADMAAGFWSSTEGVPGNAYRVSILFTLGFVLLDDNGENIKDIALSVRCVQDKK